MVPAGVWETMGLCVEERECKLRESGECSCERGDTLARGGTAQYAQRREMGSLGGQMKRRNRERDSCGTTYKNPAVSGERCTSRGRTEYPAMAKKVLHCTVFDLLTLQKKPTYLLTLCVEFWYLFLDLICGSM